ncbi:MAG: MBL fold metallo-hydrolase, partial [Candidatus Binatia bacterium]
MRLCVPVPLPSCLRCSCSLPARTSGQSRCPDSHRIMSRAAFATPSRISAPVELDPLESFVARRLWASFTAPRTFDAPRIANDGAALRAGLVNPSISWIGPRRLSPPGLAFEDLPRIDVVVISHDHYDHLDLGTVKRLAETHDPLFLVPLGLKAWFADNGMSRVEELDWWQEREYRGVRFVCVPSQHFSQRTLWDGNTRLWASWTVLSRERRLYFGGDTGYFAGFKEAGQRLGPFDVAA